MASNVLSTLLTFCLTLSFIDCRAQSSKDDKNEAAHQGQSLDITGTSKCPDYGGWMPWTEKCARWTTLAEMRNEFARACQVPVNGSHEEPDIGFKMPQQCGHCSVKIRCRKRPGSTAKGCFPLDPQMETCHEYSDVCTLDKHPDFGCRWNTLSVGLKNCADQPHFNDHRRDSLRRFADKVPDMNCYEKDDQCKCCCHPYRPNKEGTECVKIEEEPKCDSLGEYNQWSHCLWYPLRNVTEEVRTHCHLGVHTNEVLLPKPTGLELSEPCGFCSFKVRCRTRDRQNGCFHIQSDKKPCGPKECPTCGGVCTVPKVDEKCDWEKIVGKTSSHKEEAIFSGMPYWRLRGINKLRELPRGVCKEIKGQCKCCCHPFEPSEDGSTCVPTGMCAV